MKTKLLILLSLIFLVSCGGSTAEDEEYEFYSQYLYGNCGLDVVSDYNSMVMGCKYVDSYSELSNCESLVKKFDSKYHGINCQVESGYGLTKSTEYIQQSSIDSILESIESAKNND